MVSIAELTSAAILIFVLHLLGVFGSQTGQLWDFATGVAGADYTWSWSQLTIIVPAVFVLNLLGFTLTTIAGAWLFNIASALSGGVILQFEILDDPR